MEIHYPYEDIEPYEDYVDPEGSILAHSEELGIPPPIPLAEPWELGLPVLIRDEPYWQSAPTSPAYKAEVSREDPGLMEDEVANMIAVDWFESVDGEVWGEIEDRREVGAADYPELWDQFVVSGPFADIDPSLYRIETAASATTAVEAWMSAQPLAGSDPTAALVRDRAEERLRVVAPEQMAEYDQLRSGSRLAPLEAMRTVAPSIQRDDAGAVAGTAGGPQPGPLGPWASLSREPGTSVVAGGDSPAWDVVDRTNSRKVTGGSEPGPLGPWASLNSAPGPTAARGELWPGEGDEYIAGAARRAAAKAGFQEETGRPAAVDGDAGLRLEAGRGTGPGPLGPWSSLDSQPGPAPGLEEAPTPKAPDRHRAI